ncbi:Manganese transport system membrane protein MntB [Botrimarina colliarenosi]|uniref:Manganese transport system membrane protein MntB n=1 Tax=Botrimarina colliarenosi TaxID=2528001 RepID=A0A5C6AFD4_9BACT|nr:metal ABC transporter permease [Botrimarina colliarenosi]TWT98127.1 Manganese transport system membrane protein MntB [Botrimarina colliarenosi]
MNAPLPLAWSWALDGWIVAAGVLCAVASALLGNFLVLRRMSLLGDAISHAVLPGLAAAFFLTGQRSSLPMFVGAVAVGLATAFLTEWVHRYGEVDEGASLGVVFTSLFAIGLVMIVQAADHVDLDPGCVLYGAIELTPLDTWEVLGRPIPRVVVVLAAVVLVNLLYVTLFFKELKITAFDPGLATTSGFRAGWMHYSLMTLVAVTAVASFESVGNILVVAMFVTPPATARLLTDRLSTMVWLGAAIAAAAAALGHLSAVAVPAWFGLRSTTTAGMMAVSVGLFFTLALFFAPHQGVVPKAWRRLRLSLRILGEDVLGVLFRADEQTVAASSISLPAGQLRARLHCGRLPLRLVLWELYRRGLVYRDLEGVRLTAKGAGQARELVRSHRLWEHYLVERAGLAADRIHLQAERFEHVTDRAMRDQLDQETSLTETDPHGQAIPAEPDDA